VQGFGISRAPFVFSAARVPMHLLYTATAGPVLDPDECVAPEETEPNVFRFAGSAYIRLNKFLGCLIGFVRVYIDDGKLRFFSALYY
jgi:hypothetical protein